ncbi:MAG: CbiX/SirB N-terminal domain-containing protein [Streptosporangiaceae bacterium]
MTTLLGVAHGTRDPAGILTVQALLDQVRDLRPWLEVEEAYAEIAAPSIAAAVPPGAAVVAVPLLLGRGYHAEVDIPRQLAATGADAVVSHPLGPHSLLGAALVDRLGAGRDCDAVVLGAAGSTSPAGIADARVAARLLSRRLLRPVTYGFVGGPAPQLGEVVGRLREQGARNIAVASYLLAPGFFHRRLQQAGADFVSPPLGAHDAIARLVLRRYDEAVAVARVAAAG